ncbi:hypothetical protein [Corynebacterium cystitidis]|uniref:hypothetical protein n=2 Tax=Corynebacterium cystitidis TaxID=35757 RepID=UPI00211E3B92|nr:hypothetical protein [Corynebacterium cystitidis]
MAHTIYRLDVDPQARALAEVAPEILFSHEPPGPARRVARISEVVEPHAMRRGRQDWYTRSVHFDGSSTPNDEVRRHSGAGRISVIAQRTMSLFETHHSSGAVSLGEILGGGFSTHQSHPMTVPEMVERIVIGGWPALLDADEARAMKYLRDYLANSPALQSNSSIIAKTTFRGSVSCRSSVGRIDRDATA